MKRILPAVLLALIVHLPLLAQESDPPPAVPDTAAVPDTPPVPDTPREHDEAPVPDSTVNPHKLVKTYFRVGVYAGYAMNFHDTQATIFTSGGECGAFNNGKGNGPAVGVFVEIPVEREWLDAVVGISFLQRGGTFGEVVTGGLPVLDPNTTNSYVELQRRHAYTADLGYVVGEIGARMTPFQEFPIYVRLGAAAGKPGTSPTHRQTEEILSPEGVLYPETNTAIRVVSAGPINDVGLHVAVSGAIGYPFPLSMRLTASPEVSYYYPLTDVTPNYRWRISSVQAGLALRWSFGKVPEFPKTPPPPPPPPALADPAPPLAVLASVHSEKIKIVQTKVTETFPILPYVFFDSVSSGIANRYRQIGPDEISGFTEQGLPHRSLAAYYDMLNIVGSRLVKNGSAKITLNGTTDGTEEPVSGAANNLARARAQAVKDYLVKTWGIEPKRINIATSPQPTFPSSMQYTEGAEENRRVEILSTDDNILQPIIFERFNEYNVDPRQVAFTASASGPATITGWQMNVDAEGESMWQQSGSGNPPTVMTWPLDNETAARLAKHYEGEGTLDCRIRVTDANGKGGNGNYAQPIVKELNPFEVSRLSLIVFDFDKANINSQNQRMISSFVSHSMLPSSTSSIIGSTDKLGEMAHNQELSVARAIAVRDLVVAERPTANIESVEGVGPSRLLYDNANPEGRYYCRTVTVEVRTPIEDIK